MTQLLARPARPMAPVAAPAAEGSARRAADRLERWWPALAVGVWAALLADLLLGGPVVDAVDLRVRALLDVPRSPSVETAFLVLDHVGQRWLCTPVLLLAAWAVHRRTGSWRSLWLVLGTLFAMNVVIAAVKFGLARGLAVDGDPSLFVPGGQAFPSGHAANAASMAALLVVMWTRWAGRAVRRTAAVVAVAVPSLLMATTSLVLGFHWASDLLAGALLGALCVRAGVSAEVALAPAARRIAHLATAPGQRSGVPGRGAQLPHARAAERARAGSVEELLRHRPGAPAA